MATSSSGHDGGTGPVQTILSWIVWIGQAAAWLIIPILVLVVISVTGSYFKFGTLAEWGSDVFLFGSKLTLASIGDMQWHLFGYMLMLSLAGALIKNRHVRVDFIRQHMRPRTKAIVDLLGHVFLLLPFAFVVFWHGVDFAYRAFLTGEGSDYDGMYDRFLIKASIPFGFALLLIAAVGLIILRVRELRQKWDDPL